MSQSSPCTILLGYILANWSITMGMSSHSSVSHCFSVSLSGARGGWDSAEDLLCMQLALHNNIGMAILIAHVMTCNRFVIVVLMR